MNPAAWFIFSASRYYNPLAEGARELI